MAKAEGVVFGALWFGGQVGCSPPLPASQHPRPAHPGSRRLPAGCPGRRAPGLEERDGRAGLRSSSTGSSHGGSGSSQVGTSPPSATKKAKTYLGRDGDSQTLHHARPGSSVPAGANPATRLCPWGAGTHVPARPCLLKGEVFLCRHPWSLFPEAGKRAGETRCLEPKRTNIREVN